MSKIEDDKKILLMTINELAENIEESLSDVLKEPEKGFYLTGHKTPLLKQSERYYKYVQSRPIKFVMNKVEIHGVEDIDSEIYNAHGDLIVTKEFIIKSKGNVGKFLSEKPTQPIIGLELARELFEHTISKLLAWVKPDSVTKTDIINRYLKDDQKITFEGEDWINDQIRQFNTAIVNFIGDARMNIYTVDIKGMDLMITRHEDYRIRAWECSQLPKQIDWRNEDFSSGRLLGGCS